MANILFIAGGKRTSLAKLFLDYGCKLFSYENTQDVPISYYADIIIGKGWNDPDISKDIIRTIEKNNIDICIPLYDQAIKVLSRLPYEYNAKCVCCDEVTANRCLDKRTFEKFILNNSTLSYLYPSAKTIEYPKISKPRYGCSSRDIHVINCKHDDAASLHGSERVVQKYIGNSTEYTVDFYVNKQNEYIGCVPRKRLRVAGGEVQNAITEYHREIENAVEVLVREFDGFKGPGGFQFLECNDTGKLYLIECNARFNGGFPLSVHAGFNMVDMLIQEYINGEDIYLEQYKWESDVLMKRTYEEYFWGGSYE